MWENSGFVAFMGYGWEFQSQGISLSSSAVAIKCIVFCSVVKLGRYGIPEVKYDAKKHTGSKNLNLVIQTMSWESRSEVKLLITLHYSPLSMLACHLNKIIYQLDNKQLNWIPIMVKCDDSTSVLTSFQAWLYLDSCWLFCFQGIYTFRTKVNIKLPLWKFNLFGILGRPNYVMQTFYKFITGSGFYHVCSILLIIKLHILDNSSHFTVPIFSLAQQFHYCFGWYGSETQRLSLHILTGLQTNE